MIIEIKEKFISIDNIKEIIFDEGIGCYRYLVIKYFYGEEVQIPCSDYEEFLTIGRTIQQSIRDERR